MSLVTLPNPGIANLQPEDVDLLMQNLVALQATINGLISGVNVVSAAGVAIGQTNGAGAADAIALADHTHVVQGCEVLAADPSAANSFLGRYYWNSATKQLKVCTDLVGPVYTVFGNPAAADLVAHAARHAAGGGDVLPDGAINNDMLLRTIVSASVTGGSDPFCGLNAWADLIASIPVTIGDTSQAVHVGGSVSLENVDTGAVDVYLRLYDPAGSGTELYSWGPERLSGTTAGTGTKRAYPLSGYFTLATGAHTLKLQGMCGVASAAKAKRTTTRQDGTTDTPKITLMVG